MELKLNIVEFVIVIAMFAIYYLFPQTRLYLLIKEKIKPYLLLLRAYLYFLSSEVPSLIQIIGIPSLLGRVAEFAQRESTLLAFFVGAIAMFYLRFQNNKYVNKKNNFYYGTGLSQKAAGELWEIYLYITCLIFVFLTLWIVDILRGFR